MKFQPKKTNRQEKMASLLQHKVADYLLQEMELPGIVSVTDVKVAPNFQAATVWLSIYASSETEVLKQIIGKRKDMHEYLMKELFTRYIPRLHFKLDSSQAHVQRISELLNDLDK